MGTLCFVLMMEGEIVRSFWGLSPLASAVVFYTGLLVLRVINLKCMMALSRSKFADQTRITKKPAITTKQHNRESVWPLGFLIDWTLEVSFFYLGIFDNYTVFNFQGLLWMLLLHVTLIEFFYYWWHVALHWRFLYKRWHQYHHASINTEPSTSLSFEIGERLSYTALFAVVPVITSLMGVESWCGWIIYQLWFDINNGGGHINFEFFPRWFMDSVLGLVWYTPSYHSIHHTRFKYNFSLFMPWPDLMFGTADWPRTKEVFIKSLEGVNRGTATAASVFNKAAGNDEPEPDHLSQAPSEISMPGATQDSV